MLDIKDKAIGTGLDNQELSKYFKKEKLNVKNTDYIVYHTNLKFNNEKYSITLDIDSTEYTTIYYKIGTLNNIEKSGELLKKLNEKTALSKLLTYYIVPNSNEVMGKISYMANEESFNGDYFVSLIERGLYNVSVDMKVILTLPYVDKLK